jgi:propane monooxygenase reductase component
VSPRVIFEPIGEEIDCAEEESVLDAAFRQGYNLVYGCREGQCSACKAYLLEGDVALKPYSTFALSDSEEANGYTLLCRAMPDTDLVVELLHFDPDAYRLEHPIRDGRAKLLEVEALTHDIRRLLLEVCDPEDFDFTPGQYVDVQVPGADATRSFSMANLPGDGRLELIVKRYPGGRFSSLLDGTLIPGDELHFTGPYGALHLRGGRRPILMVAGGSGMAPVLSLLRQLASEPSERTVRFFYGAREKRDLFYLDQVRALGDRLADFELVPVVGGFVHEAVGEHLSANPLDDPDVYMCGPPPMIDAAGELLTLRHDVAEDRIFYDKFTISADAEEVTA